MISKFTNLFNRKSNSLPTREQQIYFAQSQKSEFFKISQGGQSLIAQDVFNNRYKIYSSTQPVKTAIDYIALGCQNAPIKLMKKSKNNNEPDSVIEDKSSVLSCNFNHPSNIYNPTIDSLISKIVKEYYLNGSYAIYYNKDVHSFFIIPSDQYTLQSRKNQATIDIALTFRQMQYKFNSMSQCYINTQNESDVIFLFDKDPWLDNIQKSSISCIALDIVLYNSANLYSIDSYQNSGAGAIISAEVPMSGVQKDVIDNEINRITNSINDSIVNKKAIFSPLKTQVQNIKSSLSDMSYLEISTQAKNSIFQAFGVHPSLFTGEASTMDNFRQARQAVWQNVIIPLISEIVRNLQTVLFSANDINDKEYYLTLDLSSIQTIKENETSLAIELAKENLITINEAREIIGYNRIEGGDALRTPANMIEIGKDNYFGGGEI